MNEQTITEQQQFWLDYVCAADAFEGRLVEYAKVGELKVKDLFLWKTVFTRRGVIAGKADKPKAFVSAQERPTKRQAALLMPSGIRFEHSGSVDPQTMKYLLQTASALG